MTPDKELLINYHLFEKAEVVSLGDGRTVEAVGIGTVYLNMTFKVSDSKHAVLKCVLHVPKLACNLFSVRAAVSRGNVQFGQSRCWIRDGRRKLLEMGSLVGSLHELDCTPVSKVQACDVSHHQIQLNLLHQRYGHLNEHQLKEIGRSELVIAANIPCTSTLSFCEACVKGKMFRKPFQPVEEIRSTRRLELVHSDVCGPMQTDCKTFRWCKTFCHLY